MRGQWAVATDDDPTVGRDGEGARAAPVVASIFLMADAGPWADRTAAFLAAEGFDVVVDSFASADLHRRARAADAVVIDLGLTASSAIDLCTAWRSRSAVPIVALTRPGDEASVLDAYAAGADHVASIDITSRQLLARLRSVLRRSTTRRSAPLLPTSDAPPMLLDADRSVVVVNGIDISVTQQEFEFLELLLDRAGRVVGRAELSASLHLPSSSERSIDFFVRRLREKLERVDPRRRILVVRSVGFRLDLSRVAEPEVPTVPT